MNPLQHVLTTNSALAELAAQMASLDAVGLDTEFLRERTYRAELCLIQVATAATATCVDPLAIEDLAPLAVPLAGTRPVKVMHASRQDIEVLFPDTGPVRAVFDTQIAAALTGLPAQIGYADLVRRVLGTDLAKSHTRTDWSRRPLLPEQVEYALDDVRYLLALKDHLEEQLDRLGRLGWLNEELAALQDETGFAIDPEQAWLRVKGLQGLDPGRTRLARALGAWRERRAIARNRPRGWILNDIALREIVLRVPRRMEDLSGVPELPEGVIKHCGEEILACVREAEIPSPAPPINFRPRPDPLRNELVKKLSALSQSIARDLQLSPEVLATRRDLEQIADGRRDVPVLQGWRRNIVGERLLEAI